MKNLFFNINGLIRLTITLLLIIAGNISVAQHIQYRDKKKPVNTKNSSPPENKPIPVPDNAIKIIPVDTIAKPVVIKEDTSKAFTKSRAAFTMNPRPKKNYVEDQNMCNLLSRPELAPQLPLVINNVSPEMVKKLKKRYEGRLYSITGLNMIDDRLKYKLKICDKDNGKFRSEYLDKDGNIINDPDLDYE